MTSRSIRVENTAIIHRAMELVDPSSWYYEAGGGNVWTGSFWQEIPITHSLIGPMPDGTEGRLAFDTEPRARTFLEKWIRTWEARGGEDKTQERNQRDEEV